MADCGDAHLPDACGESGEDDAGDGCDLPRSYPLSASFGSGSARKEEDNRKNLYSHTPDRLFTQLCLFVCFIKKTIFVSYSD